MNCTETHFTICHKLQCSKLGAKLSEYYTKNDLLLSGVKKTCINTFTSHLKYLFSLLTGLLTIQLQPII